MSARLTRDEVEKVAHLSRLALSPAELGEMTTQLAAILSYVALLDEVDTDGVEPMAHAFERSNVLRPDVPTPMLSREQALANAPDSDGRFFTVPQILADNP